jgi:hypothetical protein
MGDDEGPTNSKSNPVRVELRKLYRQAPIETDALGLARR